MKINFFEGGRRLILLAQAIAVLVAVVTVITDEPYVQIIYDTRTPRDIFRLSIEQKCDDFNNDASETISRIAENGETVNIKLCFKGQEFSRTDREGNIISKEMLIPYKEDNKGMIWGASKYSPEGASYTKEKAKTFVLPQEANDKYNDIWWEKKFENIRETGQILVFTLIGFAIFSWVLGWIIRGFFGIKNGLDFRNDIIEPVQADNSSNLKTDCDGQEKIGDVSFPDLSVELEEKEIKIVQLVQFKCKMAENRFKSINGEDIEKDDYERKQFDDLIKICLAHSEEIKDDFYKSAALHSIANTLSNAGYFDYAESIIKVIVVDFIQEKALEELKQAKLK